MFQIRRLQKDVNDAERLKYLGFIQTVVLHVVLYFYNIYAYVKDKSGPLKPGVESVEGAVKTVVALVYHKFHYVLIELLKFFDQKSFGMSLGTLPPSLRPPPEGGYPPLPFIDWG